MLTHVASVRVVRGVHRALLVALSTLPALGTLDGWKSGVAVLLIHLLLKELLSDWLDGLASIEPCDLLLQVVILHFQ